MKLKIQYVQTNNAALHTMLYQKAAKTMSNGLSQHFKRLHMWIQLLVLILQVFSLVKMKHMVASSRP